MRVIFSVIFFAAFLTGCAGGYFDQARGLIGTEGARVADNALNDARWWMCNGASIGSVRRLYGDDPQKAAAYRELCQISETEDVVGTPTQ